MNVQKMNGKERVDEIVVLQLLEEIEHNNNVSQRSLSNKLGIALGLVNTYIKHLVKKGYIRIANYPKSRYKYLLTLEGISEKSRLVYKHLSYYNNLFKTVRQDSLKVFKKLEEKGVKEIVFCGVDEVAEISYLSLKETNIKLLGVFDINTVERRFLDFKVLDIVNIKDYTYTDIYISSLKRKKDLFCKLLELGVKTEKISYIGELND